MDELKQTTKCPPSNLNAGASNRTHCHKVGYAFVANALMLVFPQLCRAGSTVQHAGKVKMGAWEITDERVQALDWPTARARGTYSHLMFFASKAQVHAYAVKRNPDQVRHLDQEGQRLEIWRKPSSETVDKRRVLGKGPDQWLP
jgi:alpha/beta superfamily hydrolase